MLTCLQDAPQHLSYPAPCLILSLAPHSHLVLTFDSLLPCPPQGALEGLLVDPLLAAAQPGEHAVDVSSFAAQVRVCDGTIRRNR